MQFLSSIARSLNTLTTRQPQLHRTDTHRDIITQPSKYTFKEPKLIVKLVNPKDHPTLLTPTPNIGLGLGQPATLQPTTRHITHNVKTHPPSIVSCRDSSEASGTHSSPAHSLTTNPPVSPPLPHPFPTFSHTLSPRPALKALRYQPHANRLLEALRLASEGDPSPSSSPSRAAARAAAYVGPSQTTWQSAGTEQRWQR